MTETTPDLLRRAAGKLRRHADGRDEYGWRVDPRDAILVMDGPVIPVASAMTPEDASYVALMHPPVALALADLLEADADAIDAELDMLDYELVDRSNITRLARAILREGADQ